MSRTGYVGYCDPCRKRLYLNRAAARQAAKKHFRDHHLAPYRCPVQTQLWHLGNLAPVVIHGDASRAQIYRSAA